MTQFTRFPHAARTPRCRLLAAAAIALAVFSLTPESAPALAGPLFAAGFLSFESGGDPSSVAVADLNGDGTPDLVTTNEYSSTVSVLLGSSNGMFGANSDFVTGSGPHFVVIADLNGDARLDLAVGNSGTYPDYVGSVSVLLGNGDGTFGWKTDYAVRSSSPPESDRRSVAIADLNGDRKPDLVVANRLSWYSGSVSVLLGNGDGTFGTRTEYETGAANFVAIADLNRDGSPDLAVANQATYYSGVVSVLLGNGDGTFGPKTDFATGMGPESVAIADLSGDGKLDLAVATSVGDYPGDGPGDVSVLIGNGDGTFQAKTDYRIGLFPASIAIGDLNNDGNNDLATANNYGGSVSVLLGSGNGTFGARTDIGTPSGPKSVAIADLNGDSKPDLAVAAFRSVSVLLGNGNGTFGPKTGFGTGTCPVFTALGELNGDGIPDVVTANVSSNTMSVLPGNGNGTLGTKSDFETGGLPYSVAVGDLNADGNADLVTANEGDVCGYPVYTVSVLLGHGDGTFAVKTDYEVGVNPKHVAIGDLNGDGTPDLVTANFNDACIIGSSRASKSISTVAGDLVGEAASFSVLLGNGDGTFSVTTRGGWGMSVWVAIGDLNRDGRLDLVVASWYPNRLTVLLGNGIGEFGASAEYEFGEFLAGPSSVAIGDLDMDGNPDLAVTYGVHSGLSVIFGNGDGTFGRRRDLEAGNSPYSVAIADLNLDGNPDLAATGGGTVAALLGNGDGTFSRTNYSYGPAGWNVSIGDLNGDGKPDLVTPNAGFNTVTVMLAWPPGCIATNVQLEPGVVNLRSMARWATCILEPPSPFEPGEIDVGSIQLASAGGSIVPDPQAPVAVGDADGDGIADLMVKFQLPALIGLLQAGPTELTVTGALGGRCFEGSQTVRVVPVTAPAAGSTFLRGVTAAVRWEPPTEPGFASVDLFLSLDDGASWTLQAQGLPNSGRHDWLVPDVTSHRARLAVSMVRTLESGATESRTGFSGPFAILSTTAADAGMPSFALHGLTPNPVVEALQVSFSLPDAGRAVLALYDVAGRQVTTREVGALGAGRHTVTFARAGLAAGVYIVRLSRQGTDLRARAILVR